MIEVVTAGPASQQMGKNRKPYSIFEIIYKNKSFEDKVETKKLTSFSGSYDALLGAKPGSVFTIERAKDDAGYWQWNSALPGGAPVKSAASPAPTPIAGKVIGSNYETPDEREWYRTRSIRGFALGHAISLLKTEKTVPSWEQVQAQAAEIEQWMIRTSDVDPMQAILEMPDDIPQ